MAKKALIIVLALGLVLPALTQAQERTLKTPAAVEKKAERVDKQVIRQEKYADRASQHLARVTERLNRAITRIGNLLAKADKYMTQLEDNGVDMAKARSAEVEAKMALDTAQNALADLPNIIGPLANPDKLTVVEIQTIRQAIQDVAKLVRSAHEKAQTLVKTIRGIAQEARN